MWNTNSAKKKQKSDVNHVQSREDDRSHDLYKTINIEPQNKTKLKQSLNREITYLRKTNRSVVSFKFALVAAHKCAKSDLPSQYGDICDYVFKPKNDGVNVQDQRKNNGDSVCTVIQNSSQSSHSYNESNHTNTMAQQPYGVINELGGSSLYGTPVHAVECNTCGQLFKGHLMLLRHVEQTHTSILKPQVATETHPDDDNDIEIVSTVAPRNTVKSSCGVNKNKATNEQLVLLSQFADQHPKLLDVTGSRPTMLMNSEFMESVSNSSDALSNPISYDANVSKFSALVEPQDTILATPSMDVEFVNKHNDDRDPTLSNEKQNSVNDTKPGYKSDDINGSIKVEMESDSEYTQDMNVDGKLSSRGSCPECPNTYDHKWDLKRHMKRAHKDKTMSREERGAFECPECFTICSYKRDLKEHMKRAHSKDKIVVREKRGNFACRECCTIYSHESTLKRHMKQVHQHVPDKPSIVLPVYRFTCKKCMKSYKCKRNLKKHVKLMHCRVENKIENECRVETQPKVHSSEKSHSEDETRLRTRMTRASTGTVQTKKSAGADVDLQNVVSDASSTDVELGCDDDEGTDPTRNSKDLASTGDPEIDDIENETNSGNKEQVESNVSDVHCRIENDTEKECSVEAKPEIYSNEMNDTEKCITRDSDYAQDMDLDRYPSRVSCPHCPNTYAHTGSLRKHMKRAHPNDTIRETVRLPEAIAVPEFRNKKSVFVCPECPSTYVFRNILIKHMIKAHSKMLNIDMETDFHDAESGANSGTFSCVGCYIMYNSKVNLYMHMKEAHPNLTVDFHGAHPSHWYTFKCYKCNTIFNNKEELVLHVQTCNAKDTNNSESPRKENNAGKSTELHKCDICGTGFSNRHVLKTHEIKVHRNLIKCQCGNTFNREQYHSHINVCDSASKADQTEEKTTNEGVESDKMFQCTLCMDKVASRNHALQHLQNIPFSCSLCGYSSTGRYKCARHIQKAVCYDNANVENKPVINTDLVCQACDIRFEEKTSFLDHWENKHTVMLTQYVNCKICSKLYPKHTLNTHMQLVHIRSFVCDLCGNSYGTAGRLKTHQLTHEKPMFSCSECDKLFHRKTSLNRHTQDVHKAKKKSTFCDICGRGFKNMITLKAHKNLIHSTDEHKKFSCSLCKKKFAFEGLLKNHMATHTSVRSIKCPLCLKLFKTEKHLKTHVETHSAVRKFACQKCSATFKREHHLQAHMLKHTGARDFPCDLCDKRFSRKQILQTHRLSHTGERPFSCDECSKNFSTKTSLKKHMKEQHGDTGNTLYVEISTEQECV